MTSKLKKPILIPSERQLTIPEQEILGKIRARAIKKAAAELNTYEMDELEEKLRINSNYSLTNF